jgi:transcriptional regulator with XRE-family HTH domain
MNKANSINERIKEYRIQMQLSQEYVAKYLDVNRATFTQIELGNRKVTAEEVAKLGVLFGISSDTLLYGNKTEAPSVAFARSFEQLDEYDQNEIMNLIRFKEMMKAQKNK